MKCLYLVEMYVFNGEFNVYTDALVKRYDYVRSYGEHMHEFMHKSGFVGFNQIKIVHVDDFNKTFILGKTNDYKEAVTFVVSDSIHLTSSEIFKKVHDSLIMYLKTTSDIDEKDESFIVTIIEELNEYIIFG